MSKIRILVTVNNDESNTTNEFDAIIQDQTLKYIENKETTVIFSYLKNILIRENNELRMEYSFNENKKTKGIILVKEYNQEINVEVDTKSIKKENNNIEIDFNVENNKFKYKVEVIK